MKAVCYNEHKSILQVYAMHAYDVWKGGWVAFGFR